MGIAGKFQWLPVSAVADDVNAALRQHPRLVVTAPPGSGKSTLLPLTILEDLPRGKVLMLEPRRLAARQVAARMASMLGEATGESVGYRVRFDSRVSASTRIEVITEGIMERMLIDDPTLDGVAAIIFDEFHERSLTSDLSLALALEAQCLLRDDLRIVVMSATIDAESLCRAMGARLINTPAQMFEVEVVHCGDYDPRDCAGHVAGAVRRACREQSGDILAFMPGQGEVMRCMEILSEGIADAEILPLYGSLPPEAQRRVLTPGAVGRRRIILSTPIAETSLTIEGITAVVDSGLCRMPVFEPSSGLTHLATVRISLDMAMQRAGRAGRLCRGRCYRLWSKATEQRMQSAREPEIMSADLSAMVLEAAAWGTANPLGLPWITPPPAGHVDSATRLLQRLGSLDDKGVITSQGRRLVQWPCHPRLSRMLAESGPQSALAADIAALLEEKDPLDNTIDVDINSRIATLRQYRRGRMSARWQHIDNVARQYRRIAPGGNGHEDYADEDAGRLIALAYPERIAQKCADGRYRLSSGEYVAIAEADPLSRHPLLAVAAMDRRIFLASPLSYADAAAHGEWVENISWDSRTAQAVARRELRVGVLTLESRQMPAVDRHKIVEAIASAAIREGLTMFDFNQDVQRMQQRIATVAEWHPEYNLPDVGTEAVLAATAEWLPMHIGNATTAQDLRKIDMCAVITGMLGYEAQAILDRVAPTHIKLPGGRVVRIDYRRGAGAPVVSARIQDFFGLVDTPRLDDGKRRVLIEFLSPGFKPVQLTQDLEGFWRTTYFEIRKELRRRYPKHSWPDTPATSAPTGVKGSNRQ